MFVIIILLLPERPKKPAPETALPQLTIPDYLKGEKTIEINFEKKDFDFPSKLAALEVKGARLTPEETKTIANSLDFTFEPKISRDVFDGTIHTYAGEISSLVARLEISAMDYTLYTTPSFINKQLSAEALISIATDFLVKNGFVPANDIEFSSFIFYKDSPGEGLFPASKKEATIFQINFSSKVTNIPILTLNPQNTLIYVRILPDGTVFSAHVKRLDEIRQSTETYRLKSFSDLKNSADEAVVISLDFGNINLSDVPENSLKKITVNKVELGYLLTSVETGILQPVYLLKGEAEVVGFQDKVNASLYLPAVKGF